MNLMCSHHKTPVVDKAISLGFSKVGFAVAEQVEAESIERYSRWIDNKMHGEMTYLERYGDVRRDPRLLLDGAKTIIVCALNYYPSQFQSPDVPQIASYALGRDYHEVVKERLMLLAQFIRENYGGQTRVCVDTAPIRERYWAVKAGLGFMGTNNQLILPGRGSYYFLGEVLTTVSFEPDDPCRESCMSCGRCVKVCPAGAISPNGFVDASKCLSYLTIEYRGELTEGLNLGNRVYGCDECQRVCPHNRAAKPTTIADFAPSAELLSLDAQSIAQMTPQQFSAIFRHSAIKRTRLAGLQRNLRACQAGENGEK